MQTDTLYPLSLSQKNVLYDSLKHNNSLHWNIYNTVFFSILDDPRHANESQDKIYKAYEKASARFIHRHDLLRSYYVTSTNCNTGQLVIQQGIQDFDPAKVQSHFQSFETIQDLIQEWFRRHGSFYIDLSSKHAYPCSTELWYAKDTRQYVFYYVSYHSFFDGNCLSIVYNELNQFMNHFLYNDPLTIPHLSF